MLDRRHVMPAIVVACLAAGSVSASASAAAGPDFFEGRDAGSTPPGAQFVFGTSSIGTIHGTLSGLNPGEPDFEDLYVIFIDDPELFLASTFIPPGSTTFDSQLFLFRVDGDPTLDGLGLLGNDNDPDSTLASTLLPFSNDGSGILLTDPGLYYLGISGAPNMPLSKAGPIFQFTDPTEISGPDGPGGPLPLIGWTGEGGTGDYVIYLEGVVGIEPPCAGDLDGDGAVGVSDLLIMLGAWGPCADPCPPSCAADVDGDCLVGVGDLLTLLGSWGGC